MAVKKALLKRSTRRYRKSTKWVKKRSYRKPSTGQFTIKRRVPLNTLYGNGTAGTIQATNNILLVYGTPVPARSQAPGYYDVPFATQYELSMLQGYTDITQICDKYKILKADVGIHLISQVGQGQGPICPTFIEYVFDSDDATVPTIAQIEEKMGLRSKVFDRAGKIKLIVYPKVAQTVWLTSITSGYAVPSKAMYLNAGYPDIPHYGFKGIIRNMYLGSATSVTTNISFDVALTVSCKGLQ